MEALTSKGECPDCKLNGMTILIQLNNLDYWECPECRLQLQTLSDDSLGILPTRGNGFLKSIIYNSEKWGERILLRKPRYQDDDCIIKDNFELFSYILTIE